MIKSTAIKSDIMFVVNEGFLVNYTKLIYYINVMFIYLHKMSLIKIEGTKYEREEPRKGGEGGVNSQYNEKLPVIQTL